MGTDILATSGAHREPAGTPRGSHGGFLWLQTLPANIHLTRTQSLPTKLGNRPKQRPNRQDAGASSQGSARPPLPYPVESWLRSSPHPRRGLAKRLISRPSPGSASHFAEGQRVRGIIPPNRG